MKYLTKILAGVLLAGLAVILLLLPVHAFLSTWGGTAIGPLLVWKSWKELLLAGLLPVTLLFLWLRPDITKILWSRWVNRLILVYAFVTGIGALFSPAQFEAIAAGLMFNLRFFALFLLAQIVVESGLPVLEKFKTWCAPALLVITVLLGVVAMAQVYVLPKDFLVQFGYDKGSSIAPYILVDENPDALRAFATLRGPNTLGAYLLVPLALALVLILKQRRTVLVWAAIVFGLAALLLTGSRSAWLGALAMATVTVLLHVPRGKLKPFLAKAVPLGLAAIAAVVALALAVPAVRLAVFHSSPGDPTLLEGSSEQHWQATLAGVADVLAHPLGSGVGTAGPASFYASQVKLAENYFVQIAQEVGVVGLILFALICIALARQLWAGREYMWPKVLLAAFAGLTIINVFLHGWADDPTAMTWWGLAGLFVFEERRKIKP
ncbi:MAG TPA: O-antigen ligase family protein [Candidatus Saccharimonadales bacterium]|nr:O-antigen ligase family protein [Candidatus Saccharimonadales bacterium]